MCAGCDRYAALRTWVLVSIVLPDCALRLFLTPLFRPVVTTGAYGCMFHPVNPPGTTTLHSQSTRALAEKGFRVYPTPVLNELRGGDFHGLTKDQFEVGNT
jgi:hypothetical protein